MMPNDSMLNSGFKIIGITGGIGAGKSLVLNILKEDCAAHIVEADKVAHLLMKPGEAAYAEIIKCFGTDILDASSKEIDRKILGSVVMQEPAKLEMLNNIVHPSVKKYIIEDIESCRRRFFDRTNDLAAGEEDKSIDKNCAEKNADRFLYVIEAALLIQDGYRKICDEIWYIHSSEEVRIKRLTERRGITLERAKSFIDNQPSDIYFKEYSDRTIVNDGSEEDLRKLVVKCLFECYNEKV